MAVIPHYKICGTIDKIMISDDGKEIFEDIEIVNLPSEIYKS